MKFVFLFLCFLTAKAANRTKGLHPELLNGQKGNPGIKFRLTEGGLAYLREIGMRVLNKEIPNLRLPTMKQTVSGNKIYIKDTYISNYWPPTAYYLDLEEPRAFSWSMENLGVTATGIFDGTYNMPVINIPIRAAGRYDATLLEFYFDATIDTGISRGRPTVRVKRCLASIGSMQMDISEAGIVLNTALNFFKGALISIVKPTVETELCKRVKEIVDRDVNDIISTMPLKINLDGINDLTGSNRKRVKRGADSDEDSYEYDYSYDYDFSDESKERKPKIEVSSEEDHKDIDLEGVDLTKRFKAYAKELMLDMFLSHKLSVGNGYATTYHKGEISWQGHGGTPFYPHRMSERDPSRSMVHAYVSDYVANSLLYHLYQQKLLNLFLSPRNMPDSVGNMLMTTCDSFCLGDLVPGIGYDYPDHQIELYFIPNKPPVAFFSRGSANIAISGLIRLYARDAAQRKRYRVLDSGVVMGAQLNMTVKDQKIVGNIQVKKMGIKMIKSNLNDLTQDDLDEMADLSKDIISGMASQILGKGVPIPTIEGLEIRKPRLNFYEHYAFVQSYFKLDEKFVHKIVNKAFKQGLRDDD